MNETLQQQTTSAENLISLGGDEAILGLEQLETLSHQGFIPAKITLAYLKLKSSPPVYDAERAKKILDSITSDETGSVNYMLAEWYGCEMLNQTDAELFTELAHENFIKAAEFGHVEAMLQLAYGYRHGIFSQQDDDKGCYWLLEAALKNHPRALFELAIHKAYGIGCEENLIQAQQLLTKALQFNYPNAAAFSNNFDAKRGENIHLSLTATKLHQQPQVSTLHNILDVMECSHLAVQSMPFLKPSKVISATGEGEKVKGRSSMGTNFPPYRADFVINCIVAKLSKLASQPVATSEYLALLKYGEGEEYRVHADYFDSSREGMKDILAQGGQRTKTVVCYLNTVTMGGETCFPDLGVVVSAVAGRGVLFENADSEGNVYPSSRHAGLPITQGSKWIVTLWFREAKHR